VQHATSDETICKLTVGQGFQESRYDCSDMTAVDRIIDETWQMQRYIDALHGGEGEGWFRIVETPAQAREVVAQGKLAVILGIETSNLFRCYLTERAEEPTCDEAYVDAQLDAYYDKGVRVLFPAHKYGNRFVPGDGSNGFIEAGAFVNSGHWTNKTEDCPGPEYDLPGMFDGRDLTFVGLNEPRDEHIAVPDSDMSGFQDAPVATMLPFAARMLEGSAAGHWCQNATITPLGEHLLTGMMQRGMIIEVDHLPEWAYVDAYAMLTENDYPAAGTHGRHWNGRIYELGGIATSGGGRCQDPGTPGTSVQSITDRAALIASKGAYPGVVLGFDYNGFAGGVAPRFGEDGCGDDQPNPTVYPFESYGGDVTFTQPAAGDRVIDFDTEGMVHIGLLPELLHGWRMDAVSDSDVEPVYRGAEAYIRMWEKAEARAAVLSAE
jgi:microsomal dipeptidase-like Zn-dependent dipeptidase